MLGIQQLARCGFALKSLTLSEKHGEREAGGERCEKLTKEIPSPGSAPGAQRACTRRLLSEYLLSQSVNTARDHREEVIVSGGVGWESLVFIFTHGFTYA